MPSEVANRHGHFRHALRRPWLTALCLGLLLFLLAQGSPPANAGQREKKGKKAAVEQAEAKADPFATYVWPPPPDKARIKLDFIYSGRADVEAKSSFRKFLIGVSEKSPYDNLRKPADVAIDEQGRVLVTDTGLSALLRFDRAEQRMDVFGTRGALKLQIPLAVTVAEDGTIYVADAGLKKIVAFDSEGAIVSVYGREGELENPTDVAIRPADGRLYVADSRAHRLTVFRLEDGSLQEHIGSRGEGAEHFNFPTSLAFDIDGNLLVVDQLNARIQILSPSGEFIDSYGTLGANFGNFVRPKYVAVDEVGFIYVTDAAYNNVQIFDTDFTLLTFVGAGGSEPGQFLGVSGIDVRGDTFAIVDSLNRRVQSFRFLVSKTEE